MIRHDKESTRVLPFQHHISEKEFEGNIDRAARGHDFPPNMKGYSYCFCVFMWFFSKIRSFNERLERLESIAMKDDD